MSIYGIGIIIVILLITALLVYKSVKILQANEMGVVVRLGVPGRTIHAGLRFIIPYIEKIEIFSKKRMTMKFRVKTVITKKGMVQDYNEPIESAELDIDCTLQFSFDEENLRKTLQNAPGKDAQDLGQKLVPYVQDIVREVSGKLPWRIINQNRNDISAYILCRLIGGNKTPEIIYKDVSDKNKVKEISFGSTYIDFTNEEKERVLETSPFCLFALKDLAFMIEDINFSDEKLRLSVSLAETARLTAGATRLAADARQYELEKHGKGAAAARREMIKVIKENPDLEMLRALEEMAKGSSNTILYQIPAAFEQRLANILGGNNIGQFLKNLSPQDLAVLEKTLRDALGQKN